MLNAAAQKDRSALPAYGDPRIGSVLKLLSEVFEVLADAGLLDMEAFLGRAGGGHCGRPSTLRTSSTSPGKITLGVSQSNEPTRILPPSSRLTLSVVLSVVPNFSSTFSSMSRQSRALSPVTDRLFLRSHARQFRKPGFECCLIQIAILKLAGEVIGVCLHVEVAVTGQVEQDGARHAL
jgi:hypothetical protein